MHRNAHGIQRVACDMASQSRSTKSLIQFQFSLSFQFSAMADNEADPDGWVHLEGHQCQPHMVELMSFLCGAEECEADKVFTGEELLEVSLVDDKHCLNMKAHGDPCPNIVGGAHPTKRQSDSLHCAKKAISQFMPHRTVPRHNRRGDPTKSASVNDMTKEVKKFEVHGEGAASSAKRPIEQSEFCMTNFPFRSPAGLQSQLKVSNDGPVAMSSDRMRWQCGQLQGVQATRTW